MFIPPSVENELERKSAALAQNPGYKGVIELPTAEAVAEARSVIAGLGIENISVRLRPFR